MGVPLSQITNALGVFMGSQYVNDFDFNNRTYRVYVQADQKYRMTSEGSAQSITFGPIHGRWFRWTIS